MSERAELLVGERPVRVEDVARIARGELELGLSREPRFRARLSRGVEVIEQRLERGIPTYGVNTGFGASVKNGVPRAQALLLARNLPRYHGCGVGPLLTVEQSRAVMLLRLTSLAGGYSGVRPVVLERLVELLAAGLAPAIPARGSVGASGDLTPLSYLAALLVGERDAWFEGRVVPAAHALAQAQLEPLELGPKESLAIMNGTSMMAARCCLAFTRAERLARLASALTATCIAVMGRQQAHFDARIFQAKAHPGSAESAALVRSFLARGEAPGPRPGPIQERYSLRCAPQVIGVLSDALSFCRGVLEIELNGASDNPLIDPESSDVLHGGNFYGGHLAMVADLLKTQVANIADLMERQLVLLNDPAQNGGLPENLVAVLGDERYAHHGFKAMEITASALTAEALKLTMPASVFSRSTEGHNQDKVSMGAIAADDLERVVELCETVAAIHLMACAQAVDLRGSADAPPAVRALHRTVRASIPATLEDRPMDRDIEVALTLIRTDALGIPSGPRS